MTASREKNFGLSWRDIPALLALWILPGVWIYHLWVPSDSTNAVSVGDTLPHIGMCLVLGCLTAWGVAWERGSRAELGARVPRALVWGPIAFVLLLTLAAVVLLALATVATIDRGNARFAINNFWQWTSLIALAGSVSVLFRRGWMVREAPILTFSLLAGVVVYGAWEYGVLQPELRDRLARDPEGLFRLEGIAMDSSEGMLMADRIRSTEMRSVFALANSLGGYLASSLILLVAVVQGMFRAPRGARGKFHDWVACGIMGALLVGVVVALLLTKSRTAWVAASIGLVWLGLRWLVRMGVTWRQVRSSVLAGAGLVGGLGYVVYRQDPLIFWESGKSLAYRMDYWRGAWELIQRRPWLGYGGGNFQATYLQVKLPTAAESPADPHNFLLEIAHAGGMPLLLLTSVLGLLAWRLGRVSGAETPRADPGASVPSPWPAGAFWGATCFWGGVSVAGLGVLLWNFFTAGDSQLTATVMALGAAALVAWWASTSPRISGAIEGLTRRGAFPTDLALLVLAVHFLASGGWMLPGTMVHAALWMAWELAAATTRGDAASQSPRSQPSQPQAPFLPTQGFGSRRWGGRFAGVVGSLGLLLAWWLTMASPSLRSLEGVQTRVRNLAPPTPEQIRDLCRSDRWDPDLPRLGMRWSLDQLARPLSESSRREWSRLLEELRDELLKRDPGHALALEASGQACLEAAATASAESGREWLARAEGDLNLAADAYPASVQLHLEHALAAFLLGDRWGMAESLQAAEEIDARTPHRDRKLQAAVVFWPRPLRPSDAVFRIAARGDSLEFVTAEPVFDYLRSVERAEKSPE